MKASIIADDLSSAPDCGVAFARRGARTLVPLDLGSISEALAPAVGVVSVDADSRSLPPADAYDAVKGTALALRRAGFADRVYKSVDSTLRGNLGAELDAVMDALGKELAVVAPAFPLYGRTTLSGRQYLRGVPLTETEISRDPKSPVSESDLVALLSLQSNRKAEKVGLKTLRSGREAVMRRVEAMLEGGTELAVLDAETEEDLRSVAKSFCGSPHRVLWVGSTGLARHLPGALIPSDAVRAVPQSRPGTGPALLVAGSVSGVTREQILALERRCGAARVELDPLALVEGAGAAEHEEERCLGATAEALAANEDVALRVASSSKTRAALWESAAERGLGPSEVSTRIAGALGRIAAEATASRDLAGVVLTGGDTAKAVCLSLGAVGVELLDEVEPGVPLGRLTAGNGGRHEGLPVVTKAGAFGDEKTLMRAFGALKRGGSLG